MLNIPRDVTSDAQRTFRQIKAALEGLNVPLLKKFSEVRAIRDRTSALHIKDGKLFRYTKIGKKLFEEEVANAIDVAGIEKIAEKVVDRRPDVEDMQVFDGVPNEEQTIRRQYQNSEPPFAYFALIWYLEMEGNEMPEDQQPINVSFDPETPVQDQEQHIVTITFTPIVLGLHIASLELV